MLLLTPGSCTNLGKVCDLLGVFCYPHDICPVDETVIDGNGVANEAFLTGEPFEITKAPGSAVISGAVNGESALTITAEKGAMLPWRTLS